MVSEEELLAAFIEEYEGAAEQSSKARYTNATVLYSKALFALCDIIIITKFRRVPKNHTERFKILREYLPEVYAIADDIWSRHIDAYSRPSSQEAAIALHNAIIKIKDSAGLPESVEASLKNIQ